MSVPSQEVGKSTMRQPLTRVFVASDATRAADGALRVATALAARDGSALTAISIVEPTPYPLPVTDLALAPTALPEAEAEALAARQGAVQAQLSRLDLPACTDLIVECSVPLSGILFHAAARRADLIVMGLGRHAVVDRLFGTETALHAARESEVTVLAVPGTMPAAPRHALVGTDFDACSLAAARMAVRVIGPGGRLTLVHVDAVADPLPAMLADWPPHVLDRLNDAFARMIDQLDLPDDIEIETVPLAGPVAKELVACAARVGADMIVVGRHARSLMERVVLGSVATRVVRTATTAVMVVPREA
jgi:nucleotide-binding universal stress UspA family protein